MTTLQLSVPSWMRKSGLGDAAMFFQLWLRLSLQNTACRIRGRRLVIQCSADTVVVVVELPVIDLPTCFHSVVEQLLVQELVT